MSLDNSFNPTQLDCSPAINGTAFDTSNDGDLLDFVCPSQTATNILVEHKYSCATACSAHLQKTLKNASIVMLILPLTILTTVIP